MRSVRILKWAIYAAVFLLVSVLQFTPHLIPEIMKVGPLLLVPLVICFSMFEGGTAGAAFGLLAGLLWDSQGGQLFGYDAFFLLIFGLLVGLVTEYFFRNTVVTSLLLTLASTVLLELLTWFFFRSLFGVNDFVYSSLRIILPTCLYTLVFAVPFYYAMRWLNRWLARLVESSRS